MTFGLLALITTAGLAGPLLAALPRLGLPLVVGEIAAGVLLGRTGLGWIDAGEPTTAFLSEVGFAMLMFVVGTRLPLRDPALRESVRPAALAALLTLAFAVPAGFALALVGPDRPLVLAVVVATSSAAVALPILQGDSDGTATSDSAEGAGGLAAAFAIGWITLTDVGTMLAVPLVLATGGLGTVLAGAGLVLLAGAAAFLPLRWLRHTARVHALRRKSKHRGWALDLRVGLAGLFGLAALATAAGASILIAGFTAGAVLAAVGEPRRLAQQLVGVAEGFLGRPLAVHDDIGGSRHGRGRQPVPQYPLDGTGGRDGTDGAVDGHRRGPGRRSRGTEQQQDHRPDHRCCSPQSDAARVGSPHYGFALRKRDATTASAGLGQDGAQYSGAICAQLEVRPVTGLGQIDPFFARRVEEVEPLPSRGRHGRAPRARRRRGRPRPAVLPTEHGDGTDHHELLAASVPAS